ncbi:MULTISPECIES: flagellar hook-basal body complex protein FliE [Ramlibacter]|uniref:Flagellar hook-basal body complex protein FliE n=1 Tax=Ramlibacter aquaticus TaxID=2780094 RepID=A0ABR9SA37_9BURK|nr:MULTISPECIES: flagellar hook-basal body complex protein FliE [Ramlibacter]MBE7939210.1 flagellar hook-basal body complex protein FliE [Ramlibacter aquaticus]
MAISSISTGLPSPLLDALKRNQAAQGGGLSVAPAAAGTQVSFSNALQQALQSVSSAQNQAGELAEAFQADPSKVSLEDAMVAMQKSQIGFQSALHVRNRLVSAYSDIMNMQV